MFDRLKKCPGCARRRARLVAIAKAVVDAFPTFAVPAVDEYRPGPIEKARDRFAAEELEAAQDLEERLR